MTELFGFPFTQPMVNGKPLTEKVPESMLLIWIEAPIAVGISTARAIKTKVSFFFIKKSPPKESMEKADGYLSIMFLKTEQNITNAKKPLLKNRSDLPINPFLT